MSPDTRLPRDAQSILELAARSMFDLFANASEGMLLVDRKGRVVWINDQYRRFLPALGYEREEDFVGHPVSNVVQNTQMHQVLETGKPILIDLLTNKAGTFVVSRIPLRDEAGEVIGVLGIVLFDHPETTLQPLIAKFARLEQDLNEARRELASQRRAKYTFASFVGSSAAAQEVKRQARRAAQSASPVLLLGETGTGKELLAHAIHSASARAGKAFVSINAAAIPETLLEAEFFGTAPGAFTGADRKGRPGKLQIAQGGTLFLDEIGDMPLPLQSKLLRVLQEKEFEPVGSNEVLRSDVRLIAATSIDLDKAVREGRFRADLYYRINVVPIGIPPLRERLEDLPALCEAILDDLREDNHALYELDADALALLRRHAWPGNVRELRNLLERTVLLNDRAQLDAQALRAALGPLQAPPAQADGNRASLAEGQDFYAAREAFERKLIGNVLAEQAGNVEAAARRLGLGRSTLYKKMAALGLSS